MKLHFANYCFFAQLSIFLILLQLPEGAKLTVKTGTNDLEICGKYGPIELSEDDSTCTWTFPLVTIAVEIGDTLPGAEEADQKIEVKKAE